MGCSTCAMSAMSGVHCSWHPDGDTMTESFYATATPQEKWPDEARSEWADGLVAAMLGGPTDEEQHLAERQEPPCPCGCDPIHLHFELSYASYLVLRRSI